MNLKIFGLLPAALLFAAALPPQQGAAREAPQSPLPSYEPWDEDLVQTFEAILVQEGGRVKPIHTLARFTMLQFSGRKSLRFSTQDEETHSIHYSEWLMDTLLRGEVAKDLPVFIVDDSAAVVEIGVSPKSKRDHYSYNELVVGRAKLAELSAEFSEKQQQFEQSEKDPQYELDRIEGMILTLGRNISTFEYLLGQFGFARQGEFLVNESILPEDLVELARRVDTVEMLDKMPEMSVDQLIQAIRQPVADSEDERMFSGAMRLFFFHANSARGVNLFPPADSGDEEWLSAGDVLLNGLASREVRPWAREQLAGVQTLVASLRDEGTGEFREALNEFAGEQREIAAERGEGDRAALEIRHYHLNPFGKALTFFVIAFVVLAFSWLSPGSRAGRLLVLLACGLALVGLVFNIWGITERCIIRSRPPITNLYDTVIFITAFSVLLGLVIERITRIGVGALVAVVAGVLGMFLSIKYEAKEATDTMGQLVAVLDTNFWLWTHVTIINIGYAAGLVAAIIGIVYLSIRFFAMVTDSERTKKNLFRTLTRMNYGVVCFCLFFSLVGTVLGGIWANYSWGRFWGWDPKENGALMICLWSLVILHGRMAGWFREIGIHMNTIVLAIIVTFSWWGVNNLGVGLHSYGFTEGVWGALFTSWGVMGLFLLMGVIVWISERTRKSPKQDSAPGDAVTA